MSDLSLPAAISFPPAQGAPRQLFILLHGVGGSPQDMVPLAATLQRAFAEAAVFIPPGFAGFDGGRPGRQWFSVTAVSDENRPGRVAQAMPALLALVRGAQEHFGVLPPDTALVGFSQGGIMALEACAAADGLAGRVIAFSARYATLPSRPPLLTTIHLLHGAADTVVPAEHSRVAMARLSELAGDATLDIASTVGHALHPSLVGRAIVRLQTCIPLRTWKRALGTVSAMEPEGHRQPH